MIPLLKLDNISYQDFVQEALASLPKLCPSWTDYNASDPGIALIEMFAWLAEMVAYRTNQIAPENQWKFLQLIQGPDWHPDKKDPNPKTALQQAIYETVTMLRRPDRAVTTTDYVWLVDNDYPLHATYEDAAAQIGRVRCLGETALGWTPSSSSSSQSSGSSLPSASSAQSGSSVSGGFSPLYTPGSCTPPVQKGHVSVVIIPSTLTPPDVPSFVPSSSSSSSSLVSLRSHRASPRELAASSLSSSTAPDPSSSSMISSGTSSTSSSSAPVISSASSSAPGSSTMSSSSSSSSTPWVPPSGLLTDIYNYLFEKRMLTTQLHVVQPRVAFLQVTAGLFLYQNASGAQVLTDAVKRLVDYLNPLEGGPNLTGWPFDRDLYPSDLYTLLQEVAGVNFVYVDSDAGRIGVAPPSALTLSVVDTAGPVTCPPMGSVPVVDMSCFDVMWLTPENCKLSIYEPVGTPIGQQYIQTYSIV